MIDLLPPRLLLLSLNFYGILIFHSSWGWSRYSSWNLILFLTFIPPPLLFFYNIILLLFLSLIPLSILTPQTTKPQMKMMRVHIKRQTCLKFRRAVRASEGGRESRFTLSSLSRGGTGWEAWREECTSFTTSPTWRVISYNIHPSNQSLEFIVLNRIKDLLVRSR